MLSTISISDLNWIEMISEYSFLESSLILSIPLIPWYVVVLPHFPMITCLRLMLISLLTLLPLPLTLLGYYISAPEKGEMEEKKVSPFESSLN